MHAQPRLPLIVWAAVTVGFALRVAVMLALRSYQFPSGQDHYLFGTEMGRVARSLVSGHGFGSPLQGETGPTAMVGPLYPLVVAAAFKLWGVYTTASAVILLTLNAVLSALTAAVVYLTGAAAFDERVARWAAWSWALFPFGIYTPVLWIWDTSLSTLLFGLIFLATLQLRESVHAPQGAWYGASWGILVLSNTTFASLLPLLTGWLAWPRIRGGGAWMRTVAAVVLACGFVLAPWALRNGVVFGHVLLRSNFGLELAQDNPPAASGPRAWQLHPAFNPSEMAQYRSLGELAYMRVKQREALNFITRYPGRFAAATTRRAVLFWFGTESPGRLFEFPGALYALSSLFAFAGLAAMVVRRHPAAFPFASVVAVFPLVYYVTHAEPRFRHLIEPQLITLAAYGGVMMWRRISAAAAGRVDRV